MNPVCTIKKGLPKECVNFVGEQSTIVKISSCLTIAWINSGLNCYHLHHVIYERLEVSLLNPAIKNVPQGEHTLAQFSTRAV